MKLMPVWLSLGAKPISNHNEVHFGCPTDIDHSELQFQVPFSQTNMKVGCWRVMLSKNSVPKFLQSHTSISTK
jgi:hypothetical protein